jgi:hypothetical protein
MKTSTLLKKPTLLVTFLMMLFLQVYVGTSRVQAQDDKFNMSVSLNSDAFFGFYPFFAGSYAISDNLDFTFYGILWSGGTGGAWGNWTEFGVGVNLPVAEGLDISPQIGILGGNLLSSGTAAAGVLGDGIVPNLTIGLDKPKVEGEIYAGLYLPLRDQTSSSAQTTLSYLHYWANLGYKASSFFSFGAHFEHLINTGGSQVEESTDVYQWLGPYVQFAQPSGGVFSRFSFGTDLVEGADTFWKLSLGYSF